MRPETALLRGDPLSSRVSNQQPFLQALAEALHLGDHVRFSTQYVPTQELPNLIASADAGVIPYRQDIFTNEILPTKLMEYTALGIPAISARTSAIAAYFDDDMVQFFTPEDVQDLARCILLLHKDRGRLQSLRQNSDRFNQQYNWNKMGSQYVALVNGLNRR